MKIFMCMSCLAMVFAGCIIKPTSDLSRLSHVPKMLAPLHKLYEGKNFTKLENLHDVNKVSDADVADLKKFLHQTLSNIIAALPDTIDHSDTRVSYISEGKIISYYSIESLCETSNRSKCFRLEIIPALTSYDIKVWQLPADQDLAEVSKSYTETKLAILLTALRNAFPHELDNEDVMVKFYGRKEHKTLHLIAGSASTDNRRELHINVNDGRIDNTRNALFPYVITSGDVALLEEGDVAILE